MLSVLNYPLMLSVLVVNVIMPSAVLLSVVSPWNHASMKAALYSKIPGTSPRKDKPNGQLHLSKISQVN
jgi:hypothetical protein